MTAHGKVFFAPHVFVKFGCNIVFGTLCVFGRGSSFGRFAELALSGVGNVSKFVSHVLGGILELAQKVVSFVFR